jgi:hypothetical protein
MQPRVAIGALALSGMLTGCGLFDSGSPWSSGKFEVLWIDSPSNSHLAYRIDSTTSTEVVSGCVVAAGANDKYVVVKQLSQTGEGFYIVTRDRYDLSRPAPGAIAGPMSGPAFATASAALSLPALEDVLPAGSCNTAA